MHTTEKQWYSPCRLPGITYPLNLKECISYLCEQKCRTASLVAVSREFVEKRQTVYKIFLCNVLVFSNNTSFNKAGGDGPVGQA